MGLRERKKKKTRQALYQEALSQFDAHGFEDVTVDAIAEEVGVSPRTFFRYFPSKEAVLFCDWERDLSELEAYFESLPETLSVWESLYELAVVWAHSYEEEQARQLERHAIIEASETAGAYERSVVIPEMEERLAGALEARLGSGYDAAFQASIYAASLVSSLIVAKKEWLKAAGEGGLVPRVERVMETLKGLSD